MFDFDLHSLILTFSYLGIFLLMILNGALNFPSSQIIYLIVGYFVATGKLSLIPAIIFGTLGNTLGNFIIYKLVYKYGKPLIKKFLFVKEETLTYAHNQLSDKGIWWLFLGKLIPSVKVIVPSVAGLARINPLPSLVIFFSTSLIWSTLIIYIGYFFGEQITLKGYAITMGIVGAIMLLFAYNKFIKK